MSKKILFISGSLGLGHITRDIAVVRELRRLFEGLDIRWLASHPATVVLKEKGENILPESSLYSDDNIPAEQAARGHSLNLLSYMLRARDAWKNNVGVFKKVLERYNFDLCIGDESYEISAGIMKNPEIKRTPYVMIYDFLGLRAMTRLPWEWLGIYMGNRNWVKMDSLVPAVADLILFSGEPGDIPDKRFGPFLPNMREFAKKYYRFTGYMLPFEKGFDADRKRLKKDLGYGDSPLIVCAIGGTSIGKEILTLCSDAFPIIRRKIPGVRMILVCGPRLKLDGPGMAKGIETRGYVPELYRHFAACDMAVVQGGGTSTLELTALKRPFVYFPIEGDCEQAFYITERAVRHRAGIRMFCSTTTPEDLAGAVTDNMGRDARCADIPADGALRAAELIGGLL